MVGWHHLPDRHEFEQALGVDDGQGRLGRCSPWGHKESDTTEQMNNNITIALINHSIYHFIILGIQILQD